MRVFERWNFFVFRVILYNTILFNSLLIVHWRHYVTTVIYSTRTYNTYTNIKVRGTLLWYMFLDSSCIFSNRHDRSKWDEWSSSWRNQRTRRYYLHTRPRCNLCASVCGNWCPYCYRTNYCTVEKIQMSLYPKRLVMNTFLPSVHNTNIYTWTRHFNNHHCVILSANHDTYKHWTLSKEWTIYETTPHNASSQH